MSSITGFPKNVTIDTNVPKTDGGDEMERMNFDENIYLFTQVEDGF